MTGYFQPKVQEIDLNLIQTVNFSTALKDNRRARTDQLHSARLNVPKREKPVSCSVPLSVRLEQASVHTHTQPEL